MNRKIYFTLIILLVATGCSKKNITPVPFTNVRVKDSFWLQRLDTLRNKTIRYAFKRSDEAGYVRNFAIAAGLMEGRFQSIQPFDDADIFKIIEGAAYLLQVERDERLEQYVDSLIDIVVAAQEPDGYLFTNRTINNPLHEWCGKERWETDWNLSHETFNAGELYEAAVAYYHATGKRKMLDAAIKNADLICKDFNWNGIVMAPSHAVIEMALVRLYEATGDKIHLSLPMEVKQVRTHETVASNRGLLSVERGPIVYCIEGIDNENNISTLVLKEGAGFVIDKNTRSVGSGYTLIGDGLRYNVSENGQRVVEQAANVRFIPYYARNHRGATAFKVWIDEHGDRISKMLNNERHVVDKVAVADLASEEAHNMRGEHTRCDKAMGWRDAVNGGWFSYDLKIEKGKEQVLILTFHSTDGGNRTFDILINDEKIATHTLRSETFDTFFDKEFAIPAHLLNGNKITVKLDAHDGNLAGGIFSCKV